MKQKKRLNDAKQLLYFNLNLPVSAESEMTRQLFKELTRHSTIPEKCSAVDEITKRISDENEAELMLVSRLLFESLLQLELKSHLRKNMLESLEKICARYPIAYYSNIHSIIKSSSKTLKDSNTILNQLMLMIERKDLIVANPVGFSDGEEAHESGCDICISLLDEAVTHIQFLWSSSRNPQTSTAETNSLFQVAHQIIKCLTTIHQDNRNSQVDSEAFSNTTLFENLLNISTSDITPLDLRTSCGLLLTQMHIRKEKDFHLVFGKIFNKEKPFDSVEDMSIMAMFHGFLCLADGKILFETSVDDIDIGTKMLKRIFHIINTAQISSVAILGSRILNQLMVKLFGHVAKDIDNTEQSLFQNYSVYSDNSRKYLDAIWLLWDHFLDCVKHLARETFIVFIKVQKIINNDLAVSYFRSLSSSLLNSLSNKQTYSALTCVVPFVGVCPLLESNPEMTKLLVKHLADPSFSAQSANLLEALFTTHLSEVEYEDWHQFWFGVFFECYSKHALVYGFESLLEKLLIVSKDMMKPIDFLSKSINMNDNQLCLLLMCTKIHLKHIKMENKLDEKNHNLWKHVLHYRHLIHALNSGDETLCILAFNLVSESKKSTELFNQRELEVIMIVLQRNITNQNPSFRQKLVNNVKKILNRIHKGMNFKTKYLNSTVDNSEFVEIQKIHEEFIRKLFEFLKNNLFTGSNFIRRSTSLVLMELFLNLLEDESSFSYFKSELLTCELNHTLLLCLTDSYEVNKQIALNILLWINDNAHEINTKGINETLMESIWSLASSPKPPDSLTASYILNFVINSSKNNLFPTSLIESIPDNVGDNGRLATCWVILSKLKSELKVAQVSLLKASSSGPMYGLLLCLRRLFTYLKQEDLENKEHLWSDLVKDTIHTCHLIVDVVADVVRNSSPEGHLPMDHTSGSVILKEAVSSSIAAQEYSFNEERNNFSQGELVKAQAVSSQMLLLCGWRSVKEVALLFGFFIQGSASMPNTLNLLSIENVKALGDFFIVQLTETKHRGAFEQAYNGFEMVCNKLWQCSDNEMNKLPENWLKDILNIIQDENESKLCATRRSAGVPFIIQAILSSEPSVRNGLCFKSTIDLLLQLANTETNSESRIHALNILRTLYKDTRLGEAIIPYVSFGVKISVRGYKSKSWSVRNSSSLMFAAIVTRMLGVKKTQEDLHSKNAVSALVFFRRYPDLYDFFLEEVKINVTDMKKGDFSVSVFPTILVLARLAPASSDGYSTSIPLAPFVPYVLELCGSPVFKLRSVASRALIPLVSPLTVVNIAERLCTSLRLENQNLLHGSLLCLKQILKSFSNVITSSEDIRSKLTSLFSRFIWVAYESNACSFTRSCGIELFKQIVSENLFPSLNIKSLTASCFSLLLNSQKGQTHVPGSDLVVRAATDFFLTVNKKHNKHNLEPFIHFLTFPTTEIQLMVLNHCLEMKTFSSPLIQKLFKEIQVQSDSECWKLQVNLLSTVILTIGKENFSFYAEELNAVLDILLQRLSVEQREDTLAALIKLTGIILHLKLKFCRDVKDNIVSSWIDYLTKYSDGSYAPDIRVTVTEGAGELLCVLQEIKALEAAMEVRLIEILIESLVDDDEILVSISSKFSSSFLLESASEDQQFEDFLVNGITRPSSFLLEKLFYYLASKGNDVHFASLLLIALKEELSQEFGLSQEEDRAFDKGETQILKENITLSKMASESIEKTQHIKGCDFIKNKIIAIENTTELFLLPIPNSLKKDNYTIPEFLLILKRDLEYILDEFNSLNTISPFGMKHFDLWLERLARRAYVWKVLKVYASDDDDKIISNLINIETSVILPTIFSSILECLS